MASPGRTPLSAMEKAKRAAARKYRKIAEIKNLTYEDIFGMRAGDKNMGRKPVPKEIQVQRAKRDFLDSLLEYRAEAHKDHVVLGPVREQLRELRDYKKDENPGRKAADKVIVLKDYIRKETVKLEKAKQESCALEAWSGRGRKPMSKEEKIEHFNKKIAETQEEIDAIVANAPAHQQIYYKLHDARLDVRRIKASISEFDDKEVPKDLAESLAQATLARSSLEKEHDAALKDAGISKVKEVVPNNAPKTQADVMENAAIAVMHMLEGKKPEPNLAKPLPNSTNSLSNLVMLSADDMEKKFQEGEYNPHDVITMLNEKLEKVRTEQSDLDELARIIIRRHELRNEEQKLDVLLQRFTNSIL